MAHRHLVHASLALLAVLLLAVPAQAQRGERLTVGTSAPEISIETFISDARFDGFKEGRSYVILFVDGGARSRSALGGLGELLSEFGHRGLDALAITSQKEEDAVRTYRSAKVDPSIPVGIDKRGSTERLWVKGADLKNLPAAFVVGPRGKIQAIESSLDAVAQSLGPILGGRYDARLFRQQKPRLDALAQARQVKNWRLAEKYIDELLEVDRFVFADQVLTRFELRLIDQDDREGAYAYAKELRTEFAEDHQLLMDLAQKIASDPKIPDEKRDLDFALETAQQAAKGYAPEDYRSLSGVAMVLHRRGDHAEAVRLQRRAWRQAPTSLKDVLQADLERYVAARDSATSGVRRRGIPPRRP